MTTFFIGWFVFRLLETYAINGAQDNDTGKDSWEKWRKEQGLTSETKSQPLSDHWKKAHDAIQKSSTTPSSAKSIPAGTPADVISTITLPVWIREKKSPLYQPSDQEFKDYARVQADKKKVAELKKQVTDSAVARLKNPAHEANLKYIGFQGQVHIILELVPQLHPPPLYEVPALIVFKDGIGFGWKVFRPDLGTRMESILRPGVTYAAAKASVNTFFSTSWAISKAKFFGGKAPVVIGAGQFKSPSSILSEKELEKDNAIPPLSQWPTNSQSMQELLRAVHNSASTRERHSELVKNLPFSVAVQLAAATFRRQQMVGLAHHQMSRARGALQIRGTVVCMGDRGRYKMSVCAVYLPSEDKFLGPLVVNNAYVVKDYSYWHELEEKKKKALEEGRASKQRQRQLPKSDSVLPDVNTEKPPPGKEKE